MNRIVNLSKVKKCNQLWDDMPICDGGRLCSACNNVIQDFRGLTNWEIAFKHSISETKVCGIYDEHQLQTPHKRIKKIASKKKLILASAFGFFTANSATSNSIESTPTFISSIAKSNSTQAELNNSQSRNETQKHRHADSLKIVRGFLRAELVGHRDENEKYIGDPLVGCNVIIMEALEGTITDSDGSYDLDVTEAIKNRNSITLDFSYVGFGMTRKTILKSDFDKKNEIHLDVKLKEDLDFEVFGVYVKPPLHKRIWKGIKNLFGKR